MTPRKPGRFQKLVPHCSVPNCFFSAKLLDCSTEKIRWLKRYAYVSGVFLLATLDFYHRFFFSAMQTLPSTPSTPLKPEVMMASMTYGAKESNLQATKRLKWCRIWAVFCKTQFCQISSIYWFWFVCLSLQHQYLKDFLVFLNPTLVLALVLEGQRICLDPW